MRRPRITSARGNGGLIHQPPPGDLAGGKLARCNQLLHSGAAYGEVASDIRHRELMRHESNDSTELDTRLDTQQVFCHSLLYARACGMLGSVSVTESSQTCPRCGKDAVQAFYGPCTGCRDELRAQLGGEGRVVEAQSYEPKMNVTPNAVALKDD